MYYFFYTVFLLIGIPKEALLNWFNMESMFQLKISEYQELYQLVPSVESLYSQQNSQSSPIFSLENLRLVIENYWEKIRDNGLGLSEIDDFIVLIILIRLIVLIIRYNVSTSLIITSISIITGYLWYSTFISTLFVYENTLYKNSLTFKLAVDTNQIRRILQAKIISSTYQIRMTNPFGVCMYALGSGSIYEGYRIDPISMVMANIPKEFPKYDWIEGTYYLFYRKIIPVTTRAILDFMDAFTTYAVYTLITRVNKRYCPYLIRWHWTLLIILKFFEPFITYLIYRINDYSFNIVYPKIIKAKELGVSLLQLNFEIQFLNYISFTIIVLHLAFLLFALLHALCGQYFYIPFFTENVELHIGERNKLDPYSGGYTAWQDEKANSIGKLKLWYGWFGRGTNNQNNFLQIIFQYLKRLILKLRLGN